MKNFVKKLCRRFFYPHFAVVLALTPTAAVFLVYTMACVGTENIAAYLAYCLSTYTLIPLSTVK